MTEKKQKAHAIESDVALPDVDGDITAQWERLRDASRDRLFTTLRCGVWDATTLPAAQERQHRRLMTWAADRKGWVMSVNDIVGGAGGDRVQLLRLPAATPDHAVTSCIKALGWRLDVSNHRASDTLDRYAWRAADYADVDGWYLYLRPMKFPALSQTVRVCRGRYADWCATATVIPMKRS